MGNEPRGVVIPRWMLVGLVAGLAVALLLAFFLLGRQSARVETPVASVPGAGPVAAPVPTNPGAAPVALPPPTDAAAAESSPPAGFPTLAPAPDASSAPAPGVPPQERAEVARYFQEADLIQSRAKYWSDPQSLAKTLIDQMGQGKTDAFNELVASQKKARDELAALVVPAACSEHHRRTVAALGGGVDLLQKLQATIESGNMDALEQFPASSRDLEREAREIDELAKQIRQRYGT